jgi:hypothetical protein
MRNVYLFKSIDHNNRHSSKIPPWGIIHSGERKNSQQYPSNVVKEKEKQNNMCLVRVAVTTKEIFCVNSTENLIAQAEKFPNTL